MTNGVTFTPFSRNFFAITQGLLSQDSNPSVIRMITFREVVSGKSPAAASKDRAIGVAPLAIKPRILFFIRSMFPLENGTSNLVSLQSCVLLVIGV